MSPKSAQCDAGRVANFLEERLSPREEAEFERHLETCADCRRRLAEAAAEDRYWTEAGVHLCGDALVGPSDEATGDSSPGDSSEDGTDRLPPAAIRAYLDPTDDPRMLGRFGGYEIVGVVGFGGMGVVLKGFEAALDRYVAIKVLAPHLATSGAARRRFAREARAAAAVIHENVVAIHRVSEAHGLPYLVMPYMAGVSLQKRLDEQGPLQLEEILRIAMQVAAGLAAAHAQGLVHRDIKPANILLDRGVERVTITDFGLARAADDATLTRSGVITGTPQYMSPEQARGEPVDHRSDLFSLGSVIYAMCTGRPPFRAETPLAVLRRITESAPRPISDVAAEVPQWLCEIVARLHAKDPGRRFSSAGEAADLLGRWLAHVQQPTVIPAPARLLPAKPGRRKARIKKAASWAALVGAVTLGLAAVLAVFAPFGRQHGAAPPPSPGTGHRGMRTVIDATTAAEIQTLLLSEDAVADECQRIRQRAETLEARWSQSPPPEVSGSWRASVAEARRQVDELERRIQHDWP